jgi:hypothetical protein
MAEYYRQRTGAGLILSEATGISLEALGWPYPSDASELAYSWCR